MCNNVDIFYIHLLSPNMSNREHVLISNTDVHNNTHDEADDNSYMLQLCLS